jgi:hypothetical protein
LPFFEIHVVHSIHGLGAVRVRDGERFVYRVAWLFGDDTLDVFT